MLTAQDIRDVQFSKTMGGYRTVEVDEFLDQCAETLEAMTQQSEESNQKMQILAGTVVDYRNKEDSIRTALVSAQQLSEQIKAEAREKADAMIAEAEEKAAALISDAEQKSTAIVSDAEQKSETVKEEMQQKIVEEQKEYDRVYKEVVAFRNKLMSLYRSHLTSIKVLEEEVPDLPEDEPIPEESADEKAPETAAPEKEEAPILSDDLPTNEEAEDDSYEINLEQAEPAEAEDVEEAEDEKLDLSAYKLDEE